MMLKILFIVPYIPDLVRVRSFHFIRNLHRRGHRVTVLAVRKDRRGQEAIDELEKVCSEVHTVQVSGWRSMMNVLGALPTRSPLQSVFSWHPALADKAAELVSKGRGADAFDVIHVEHLRGSKYALSLKARTDGFLPRIPVVFDSVDSISLLFRQAAGSSSSILSRAVTRFELKRTERFEGSLANLFDRVLVTSKKDRAALLSLSPGGSCGEVFEVVQNGVDLSYFCPDERIPREPATIVVSGKMSYHANVTMVLTFIKDIMPHVWAQREEVRVWIVGKDPTKSILDLAKDPRITVTGTVPDIRPYLSKATLAAAPITYGTGIQNKVLEAMACATPVICTPQAASALEAVPGRDFVVAETPELFAREILAILGSRERQMSIGSSGRVYVEKYHRWETVVSQLESIYKHALEKEKTIV